MNKHFDILVFGSHPDDAEMAMGGTMIKLIRAGYSLKLISITRGEMGTYGDVEVRAKEFFAACKVVGCEGEFLDFPDSRVENTPDGRLRLAKIIRAHTPKIIFAPYHTNPLGELAGLANVDHYTTGALVRDAVKMARLEKTVPDFAKHQIQKLYFYMVPRDVYAQLYVDVSDVIEETTKAIATYATQMSIKPHGLDVQHTLRTKRAAAGIDIGVAFAERFTTDLPLVMTPQHFFTL